MIIRITGLVMVCTAGGFYSHAISHPVYYAIGGGLCVIGGLLAQYRGRT